MKLCNCGLKSDYKIILRQTYIPDGSILNEKSMYLCEMCFTIEKEKDMKKGADIITASQKNIYAELIKMRHK